MPTTVSAFQIPRISTVGGKATDPGIGRKSTGFGAGGMAKIGAMDAGVNGVATGGNRTTLIMTTGVSEIGGPGRTRMLMMRPGRKKTVLVGKNGKDIPGGRRVVGRGTNPPA